ncbi:MAG: 1-(5-phosphoribosyl)-5-[(5-phosphoribosylamino)methylideneamino]imidazole-4-carboxamide isomerase [Ignavibacteriae bacterium]|nr:1-(5-phosphoribosyl)-5-[(5-phosphoribosylamino)methylideneamino]imidazole-4-carboxamide isomerase [Ignavibacteriota bacterium]
MLIFPAIDIYQGKCVRLRQGHFDEQTVYSDSPSDVAKSFLDAGFSHLHVVDLDGAKKGQVTNWESLEKILALKGVKAQVGGGVRSKEDMDKLLELGAQRVVVGSIAVTLPALVKKWIQDIGSSRIAIALDIHGGKIAHSGWLAESEYSPNTFIYDMISAKASTFICTDIDRDGMMQGPNVELYTEIKSFFKNIQLFASGGISSVDDIHTLVEAGVTGIVVGKALYEGKIKLEDLREFVK